MQHLENALRQLNLPCNESIMQQFETYRRRVLEWNSVVNLTAIKDPEAFEIKHFVDSIRVCENDPIWEAKRIIDVGTGAGFPGIPLAILFPQKQFTLMDSLGKRMKILSQLAGEIELKNVTIIHARAEDLAREKEHREHYDLCVSRAVADLSVLCEYCLPFVAVGGWFASYKTAGREEEIRGSEKAIERLGGRLVFKTPFGDEENQENSLGRNFEDDCSQPEKEHIILWIEKTKETLAKYPRKAGMPAKEPLK